MISIVMAMRSLWACKILNGDKKIEVRKGLALYNALKKAKERGEEVEFLLYVTKAKPFLDYIEEYDDDSMNWYAGEYQLDYDKLAKLPKRKKGMTEDDPLFYDYLYNDDVLDNRKARKDGSLYDEHYYNLNGKVVARFKGGFGKVYDVDDMGILYEADGMDCDTLLSKSRLTFKQLDHYIQGETSTFLEISDFEIFDKPKTLADYGLKRAPESWCYAKKGGLNGKA